MAQQNINLGTVANDGTGDPLRTALTKTQDNFTDLYTNKAPLASPTFTGTLNAAAIQTTSSVGVGVSPSVTLHAKRASGFEVLRLETGAASGAGAGWGSFNDAGGRKSYFGHGGNNNDFFIDVTAGDLVASLAATYAFRPGSDNNRNLGTAANRWATVYAGTGAINTSDERAKAEIGDIPDDVLDAWGDAGCWQMFLMRDSLEEKGGAASLYHGDQDAPGARWHFGLVAQHVYAALEARGVNAFALGLVCYDRWEERRGREYETRLVRWGKGKNRQRALMDIPTGRMVVTLEAGNRWGIRYDAAQAIEAAWTRRQLRRTEARLAAIEKQLGLA